MHELSLARAIVETVVDAAAVHDEHRISRIKVRIGALSGVVGEALTFSFDIAARDTIAEGAMLELESVPVAIFCAPCDTIRDLPGIQRFRCPVCDTPSGDIRRGKELDIVEMEVEGTHDRSLIAEPE